MRNVGLREKNAREKRKNANVVRVLDGSTWTMRIGVTAFKFIVLKKKELEKRSLVVTGP